MALKQKHLILSALVITSIAMVVVAYLTGSLQKPRLISRNDPPRLVVGEPNYQYGSVEEGIEVPHVFKLQNLGGEPLLIKSTSTSCGCTQLNLSSQRVDPGEAAELKVTMDTSEKMGMVTKVIDVVSNDPQHPVFKLTVTANVLPKSKDDPLNNNPLSNLNNTDLVTNKMPAMDPHEGLDLKTAKSKLFTGRCATCHVAPGQGKTGKALFEASCAMCHGVKAEGAVGPSLQADLNNPAVLKHFLEYTRNGSPNHPSMPGFLKQSGGPLTEDQIQSLVPYLKQLGNGGKSAAAVAH